MKDKRKTLVKILIVSSIILNMLFIGVFAGHKFRHYSGRDSREIVHILPSEKRELFFRTFEQIRSQRRTIYPEMKEVRQDIFRILTAPIFDGEAYQNKIVELHEIRKEMHLRSSLAVKELASQFTQEEREVIAKYLMSMRGGGRRHLSGHK